MRPLIPLLWTSGGVSPGFQSQGGSLVCFVTCVILRFTSGATLADCIEVSMAAEPFRSTYLHRCPQPLMEAGAGARTCDRLCDEHSIASLADMVGGGGARYLPPSLLGQNSFIFMPFLASRPWGLAPLLCEILDPPLAVCHSATPGVWSFR